MLKLKNEKNYLYILLFTLVIALLIVLFLPSFVLNQESNGISMKSGAKQCLALTESDNGSANLPPSPQVFPKQSLVLPSFCHLGGLALTMPSINSLITSLKSIDTIILISITAIVFIAITMLIAGVLCNKKRKAMISLSTLTDLQEVCNNVPAGLLKISIENFETRDDLKSCVIEYINSHSLKTFGFDFSFDTPMTVKNLIQQIPQDLTSDILQDIKKQLLSNRKFKKRFPIVNAKGEKKWVSFQGNLFVISASANKEKAGKQYLICSHIDVTKEVSLQHNLYASKQRFESILTNAGIGVISFDIASNEVYTSPTCLEKFGDLHRIYKDKAIGNVIEAADLARLSLLVAGTSKEKPTFVSQARIFSPPREQFIWCKIEYTALYDNEDLSSVIVRFSDIDKLVQQNLELKYIAERDSMTGIFNKKTTEHLISHYLETSGSDGNHALLVADIDNFKKYNDTYGHQVGDKIITGVARAFCKHFRSSDIVGRIGGDEFVVFLKNIPSLDFVKNKCHELHLEYVVGDITEIITLSIGIATFPERGTTFMDLYKAADQNLYIVKKKGKNGCEG